jgi:broad specificity phosphatase PhoE
VQRITCRGRTVVKWKQLDEIDAGVCDGMTYEEVASDMPAEYVRRSQDKLNYRYPRGESYQDVIHRLEPVITELLRQREPLLIVAHQAILRVLYGYLTDISPDQCPTLTVPLHVVIQLTPKAYKCEEVWHRLLD